jgi:archaellum component FlaG (FlaF/FlaG flagellin family)
MYSYQISGGDVTFSDTVSGGQSSGDFVVKDGRGTLTVRSSGEWTVGVYNVTITDISVHGPSMDTSSFPVRKGCQSEMDLEINATGFCVVEIPAAIVSWKVESDRTYKCTVTHSGKSVTTDTIPGSGNSDFTVVNGRGQIDLRVDPGSYTVTVQDLEAGVKEYHTESMDFSVPECPVPIDLVVPDCVKSTESTFDISWNVRADRMYRYQVHGGDDTFTDTVSGGQSSGDFVVKDGRGTLTVRSSEEWTVGVYSVTVTDISVHGSSMNSNSFNIKKGCQPEKDLKINATGFCIDEIPAAIVSWKVKNDRTYKYSVNQSGQRVATDTIRGSGNSDFTVVNGRGQIDLRLDPGNYTVTVQDLEAGVKEYHTESMDFSVPDCRIPLCKLVEKNC